MRDENKDVMSGRTLSDNSRNERIFSLSLPAAVSGMDDRGRMFHEETRITAINACEAQCGLKARVPVGTAVRLSLDVPGTLLLGPPLKLFLAGEISATPRRKQIQSGRSVRIKLFGRFRLQPAEMKSPS
ncbi:MAG: hypothetical protein SCM96_00255 [Acidobacteriota bacterium]|nr:hypothetical protein [Acidobacteriota bacterium]